MPLVVTLKSGEDFFVGDERFVILEVFDETHFRVRRASTGEVFEITPDRRTEVLDEVFLFGARRKDPKVTLRVDLKGDVTVRRGKAKKRIANQIGANRPQMTTKNMERLAQFDDRNNVLRLVNLPDKLMNRARQNPDSSWSALDAMHAVAIAILLTYPMRIANLADLDIERDLTCVKKGNRRRYYVRVEGPSVKNGVPIDFDLDTHVSPLLSRYLDNHRRHLADEPGTALFPRRSGGPRRPDGFGESIQKLIWRETGLVMNAHLFRHLAGMLFLQRYPGEFETVRRLLGHKKLETTRAFYARFDAMWAARRYEEGVLSEFRRVA